MKIFILSFNGDSKNSHGTFSVIGSLRPDLCRVAKQPIDRSIPWDVTFRAGHPGYPYDGVVTAFPFIFCDEPLREFFEGIDGVRLQNKVIYDFSIRYWKAREEILALRPYPCEWTGDRYLIHSDTILEFSGDFIQSLGVCPECGGEHFRRNPEGQLIIRATKDPVLFKLKGLEDSYLFATETFIKRWKKVSKRKPDYFTLPINGELIVGRDNQPAQ